MWPLTSQYSCVLLYPLEQGTSTTLGPQVDRKATALVTTDGWQLTKLNFCMQLSLFCQNFRIF